LVQGSSNGQWALLQGDQPEGESPPDPTPLSESTTLKDGTHVLSIRIHAGRKPFDEQHTVIALYGESRIFETSGATQTIRDGQTGNVLSRSTFTATDLVSEPLVQPAFLPAVPLWRSKVRSPLLKQRGPLNSRCRCWRCCLRGTMALERF